MQITFSGMARSFLQKPKQRIPQERPLAYTRDRISRALGHESELTASMTRDGKRQVLLKGEARNPDSFYRLLSQLKSVGIRVINQVSDPYRTRADALRKKLKQPRARIFETNTLTKAQLTQLAKRPRGVFVRRASGEVVHITHQTGSVYGPKSKYFMLNNGNGTTWINSPTLLTRNLGLQGV